MKYADSSETPLTLRFRRALARSSETSELNYLTTGLPGQVSLTLAHDLKDPYLTAVVYVFLA